jgi:hypothetical protein
MNPSKLAILGCGWLGEKIANHFHQNLWEIFTFNSSTNKKEYFQNKGFQSYQLDFNYKNEDFYGFFDDFEAIVIAVPMSRQESLEQLIILFKNISDLIKNSKANVFLCSSTGVYPQKIGLFDEKSFENHELNEKIFTLEKIVKSSIPKVNILRLGGLMGDTRVFHKYFTNQDSLEAVNHIHFQDIVLILEQMIFKNCQSKIYNVVAPIHPSKKAIFEFQRNKNIIIDEIQDSRIILSHKLIQELNYTFAFPNPIYFEN